MRLKAIAAGCGLLLIALAVIGLPAYESHVEEAIAAWVERENARQSGSQLTYERIEVDLWRSTVTVENARLSGPFSDMRAGVMSFDISSPLLLFPHDQVNQARLTDVIFTDPGTQTSLTFQEILVDDLSGYAVNADAGTRPAIEILEALTVETITARDGLITDAEFGAGEGAAPLYRIEIGQLRYTDIAEGRVSRMEIMDLSSHTENGRIQVPSVELQDFGVSGLFAALGRSAQDASAPAILSQYRDVDLSRMILRNLSLETESGTEATIVSLDFQRDETGRFQFLGEDFSLLAPTGNAAIATITFEHFDLDGLMLHVVETNAATMTPGQIFQLIDGGAFAIQDMSINHQDGSEIRVDQVRLGELESLNGVPTRFRVDVTQAFQTAPRADGEAPTPGTIDWDLPQTLGGDGSLIFAADLAQDSLRIDFDINDTVQGVEADLSVALLSTSSVLSTYATGVRVPQADWLGVALARMTLSIDSGEAWTTPDLQHSPPTPRAFLITRVQMAGLPPELEEAISAPVLGYLSEGGVIDLDITPRSPLTGFQILDLTELPAGVLLDVTGLRIKHRIYGTN